MDEPKKIGRPAKPKEIVADNVIDAGREIVRKKRPHESSPMIGDNGIKTEPGDNTRYAAILTQFNKWGPVDPADVKALDERFWMFVEFCGQNDMRITNQMAYFALGINKDNVYDWEHGRGRTPAHSEFIKKIKQFCSTYREMLGADGKINPVTLVWWQKNYDGFVDKSEVVLTPNNPLGAEIDESQMAQKYRTAIPGVEPLELAEGAEGAEGK